MVEGLTGGCWLCVGWGGGGSGWFYGAVVAARSEFRFRSCVQESCVVVVVLKRLYGLRSGVGTKIF
jgi:hypothetical protein